MIAHFKQTLAAALLLALLTACGGADDAVDESEPVEPGQAAFGRYCASCHGIDGEGRAPAFPPLAGSEWLELPAEALTTIVLLGLRGEIEVAGQSYAGYMPPMQHVDDADVAAIIEFITRRWSTNGIDWAAQDVAAVRSALAGERSPEGREELDRITEALP